MRKTIFALLLIAASAFAAGAQGRSDKLKPQWLRQVPSGISSDAQFVTVRTFNGYGQTSYADEMGRLVVNLPSEWKVATTTSTVQLSEREIGERRSSGTMKQVGSIETEAEGKPVSIQCMRVDEFSKGVDRWVLYQVAKGKEAKFAECYVTDRYGAAGCLLSIIPGCGQFYKGDPLKGGLFLGGCVAGGLGALFSESQRQAYISQLGQTHDINVIRQLDARQKNLGIARNVCLGATAALYVWNLIDGAMAPGAKKIKFTGSALQYNF